MSQFSDRYYVKLLTQVIDRECIEGLRQNCGLTPTAVRRNLMNMLAESTKAKRMLKEASDAMEETAWED